MKKTFKERLSALGLSYPKEILIIILISILSVAIFLVLYLVLKELYVALIALALGVVILYFYTSRYKSLEKQKEKENVDELISLLAYFEIFISNGHNVYTSLKMLLPYSSQYLSDAITSLLNQIDVDKTVGPFITFASKFNNRVIDSLMLSIYQMVDNGENVIELTEFDLLFNNIKNKNQEELTNSYHKSLDSMNSFPLIGAGAITIILSISIISIIGDYINVI